MASSSLFATSAGNLALSSAASTFTTAAIDRSRFVGSTVFDPGRIRPDLFIDPGLVIPPIFVPPQPPPQPAPSPQPASPTASASDLQVMIAAIPIAQDGHVITTEYHNALRLALVAIANRLGLGVISEEITITIAPNMRDHGAVRGWEQDYGIARKPQDVPGTNNITTVHGWMELDLPEGGRIKKMVVFGRCASTSSTATTATLRVQLRRQSITNPNTSQTLIEITIGDIDQSRGVDSDVTLPGLGAGTSTIEEFRVVNNRDHKYLFVAELESIDANTTAQINAIQVVCGR